MRKTQEEARRKKKISGDLPPMAYTMVLNYWTDLTAPRNYLTGEFRFESDSRRCVVSLYEDPEFVKAREPEATIMLRPAEAERAQE